MRVNINENEVLLTIKGPREEQTTSQTLKGMDPLADSPENDLWPITARTTTVRRQSSTTLQWGPKTGTTVTEAKIVDPNKNSVFPLNLEGRLWPTKTTLFRGQELTLQTSDGRQITMKPLETSPCLTFRDSEAIFRN